MLLPSNYFDIVPTKYSFYLKNKNQGVVILPITEEREVLLLNIYRESLKQTVLELPRGFLEAGETSTEGAKRELKEETNCLALNFINLGYVHPDSGLTDSKIHLYIAYPCRIDNIILEHKENIQGYTLIPLQTLCNKIYSGEVNDGFTIAAVFRTLHYFDSLS